MIPQGNPKNINVDTQYPSIQNLVDNPVHKSSKSVSVELTLKILLPVASVKSDEKSVSFVNIVVTEETTNLRKEKCFQDVKFQKKESKAL